jgi:hypothetical protein
MARVDMPVRERVVSTRSTWGDAREGLAFALRREPIRSLMALSLLLGVTISVWSVNLPELGEKILEVGPFATGLLAGTVGLGMMGTSMVLASRVTLPRLGMLLALALGVGLGPGLFLVGWSRSYVLSLVVMLVWGMSGGVAMSTHRTLVQLQTPDEMMGRVMGTSTLLLMGAFPLGAAFTAALSGALGPAGVMMVAGAAVTAAAIPLTLRRAVRSA